MCVSWPFRPLSQSALMAESNSHWLLNSWCDCITRWVTDQAFGVRLPLLCKMTTGSLSEIPTTSENRLGNNTNLCQTDSINDPKWRNYYRRELVLEIECFEIKRVTFSYQPRSGILFQLWIVYFSMFLHNKYGPSKLLTRHFISHVFIHSSYNIGWGHTMLKELPTIYLNRK